LNIKNEIKNPKFKKINFNDFSQNLIRSANSSLINGNLLASGSDDKTVKLFRK